jgi:hypothetical protein
MKDSCGLVDIARAATPAQDGAPAIDGSMARRAIVGRAAPEAAAATLNAVVVGWVGCRRQ